jgi:hypothetical protein
MGAFRVYAGSELAKLTKKQRQTLANAILRQIKTSPQVRKILKGKTLSTYKRLAAKKA